MKVLITKEKTVVLELEYEAIKHIFKDMSYKSDFELACKNNTELSVSFQTNTFNDTDHNKVKRMIESIESTLKFLKNQSDDLYNKGNK